MRRALAWSLVILPPAWAAGAQSSAVSGETLLGTGIAQYAAGDFEAAVFALDTALRRLAVEAAPGVRLAQAYLYLGASYVGLDHVQVAKGKFREALAADPALSVSPDAFPKRVVELFEAERLRRTAVAQTRGRKKLLIVAGGVAAAGIGVVAATGKEVLPPNRSPLGRFTVLPAGQAIAGVTVMRFAADASDPDGDPLAYEWRFGDGVSGSGATAAHAYAAVGSPRPSLSISDGKNPAFSVEASTPITVRTLTGSWQLAGFEIQKAGIVECTQSGADFDCRRRSTECSAAGNCFQRLLGRLVDPRGIDATVNTSRGTTEQCRGQAQGVVTDDLGQIRCSRHLLRRR